MVLITPDKKQDIAAYIEYLKRYVRKNKCSIHEANQLLISRCVGRYYGLTEKEMDSIEMKVSLV